MTRNQIEVIKARETERNNRAMEDLTRRGQNTKLAGDVYSGTAKALGSVVPKLF